MFQPAGSGSSGGTGTGSKNYLSTYTASTSSGVANTGNGDFETAATTGWGKGNVTLTSNLPTGAPTFGSGASANLSISAVIASQLAATASLSYASSAATVAGNFVASDPFFIDIEDQAKVLTFKFYYKAQTNPSNGDWSGTTTNSFGVAIYDVTNSAWIIPAGCFGMTQSSGVGYCTGTFQTTSNSTQYRLVVYNANASSGAITVYFDDFFVGPQTAPLGAVVTDWVAYTPTISGFGTPSGVSFFSRRDGDTLKVHGTFTAGTVAASAASVSVGYNGTNANVTIDTTKISTTKQIVGKASSDQNSTTIFDWTVVYGTTSLVYIGVQNSTNPAINTPTNGSTVTGTGNQLSMYFEVPIVGWSSNVQMSSDTDTRVVAAKYRVAASVSSSTTAPINFATQVYDTHGAVTTGAAWKFTAPITGKYSLKCSSATTSGTPNVQVYVNGVVVEDLFNANSSSVTNGSSEYALNAGDYIDVRYNSALSTNASGSFTWIAIDRLSGPSVIAATESVNARYVNSSTSVSSSDTTIVWTTKDFDSHNAMSSGVYTVPVSGKYQVNSSIQYLGTYAAGQNAKVSIYVNGVAVSHYQYQVSGSTLGAASANISDLIKVNAGDLITIKGSTSATSPSINSTTTDNWVSIFRAGN